MAGYVLFVDDEQDVRESVEALLVMLGFRVRTAVDGADALNVIADSGSPCLIVTDWHMPRGGGAHLLAVLARDAATAKIPTIVFTAAPFDVPAGPVVLCKSQVDELLDCVRALAASAHDPQLQRSCEAS